MLANIRSSRHIWTFHNWGANFGTSAGLSLAPANGSKGAWGILATAAQMTEEASGFCLWVHTGGTANANRPLALDIGIDPAGGTSYSVMVADIVCGNAGTALLAGGGHKFFFPLRIPAGAQIAVRGQSNATTAVRVGIKLYGKANASEMLPRGSFTETVGYVGSGSGTTFTPGNAADGAWAELGTTTRPCWWWQLGYSISNTTIMAEYTYIQLAYGDATNKHMILERTHQATTGELIGDVTGQQVVWQEGYCRVPAGATLYVRGRANDAPDTGYNAVAIGVGG